jgi:hypothetical protein
MLGCATCVAHSAKPAVHGRAAGMRLVATFSSAQPLLLDWAVQFLASCIGTSVLQSSL